MGKGYKITMWVLMALTIVVVISDCRVASYKDAFYHGIQFIWLCLLYFACCGWLKVCKYILNELEQTNTKLQEANKREQIAHNLIADLRKRLESKN